MKPQLSVISNSNDAFLTSIINCIVGIECSNFFSNHLEKSQPDQRKLVGEFQSLTESTLKNSIEGIDWYKEHCPNPSTRDSMDIFGKSADSGFVVVIEIDKTRADQIAKKFVSRMALFPSTKVYFVSLCYPGTPNMNKPECVKSFGYCKALALRMGSHYAGLIVE